jgi:hypothetical protein
MKENKKLFIFIIGIVTLCLSILLIFIIFDGVISKQFYDTYPARILPAIIAFFSFLAQSIFNVLIITQNKNMWNANQDANKRAEVFRDQQFIASNYSIIEFMDRMLMSVENKLYIEKYIGSKRGDFHMILNSINSTQLFDNEDVYQFVSIRIPFQIIEGKTISHISVRKITFQRNEQRYVFRSIRGSETSGFIIFNGITKRQNLIMNLIVNKDNDFFRLEEVSPFSRIKIELTATSILGVSVPGTMELYFKNPDQIELDYSNSYKITSSIFLISDHPVIEDRIIKD